MCFPLLILGTVAHLEVGRDCLILPDADYNDSNNDNIDNIIEDNIVIDRNVGAGWRPWLER